MFLVIFAVIRGNENGWTSTLILGCFAASAVLFIAFGVIELRREFPMFDLRLFKNPTFVGSSVAAFTICFTVLAMIFFLTTWFQSILGYSAIGTGVRILAFTGASLAVGPIAGKMTETVDPRFVLTVSLALVAIGMFTMTSIGAGSTWTGIIGGLILTGVGLGLVGPTLASTAVGVVPPWRGGMAGGMNSTMREGGTTAGIAVLGALVQHQVSIHVHHALASTAIAGQANGIATAIAAGQTQTLVATHFKTGQSASFGPGILSVAHDAYTAGLAQMFVVAGIVATIGAITAFATVRKRHMREDAAGGH
jgi:predicted MFS family arabinose efflux permease